MSFLANTYSCGNAGSVRRLTNLVGSWMDVSLGLNGIPDGAQSSLLDIETDPTNGSKVFVVGEGYCSTQAFNWFGIAVSSNAGNSWQVPGGNYQTLVNNTLCYHKWIEVSVVDANVIYVCGIVNPITKLGTVAKSTDGGATFNLCAPLPVTLRDLDCTSIHFITPLIGVIGLDNYIVKTTDGGNSWFILNNGQPLSSNLPIAGTLLPIGPITGIYISPDQGFIMGVGLNFSIESLPVNFPTPIFDTGLGVDTWKKVSYPPTDFPNPIGLHLTYLNTPAYPKGYIGVSGNQDLGILYDPIGGAAFSPAPGYLASGFGSSRRAAHFYKINQSATGLEGFYNKNNNVYYNSVGFFTNQFEILSDTVPNGVNALWTWYEEQPPEECFLLIGCDGTSIVTNTDMSAYVNPTVYFQIVGDSRCFSAIYATDCTGAIPVVVTGPTYPTCLDCAPEVSCYTLTDCSGQFNTLVTNDNLVSYVGKVVQLDTYPGLCWQVAISQNCPNPQPIVGTITLVFDDCPTCLQRCYRLTDCTGAASDIIVSTDLSLYLNKVIKILSQPNVCWLVTLSDTCTNSQTVEHSEDYLTCELCLSLPTVPEIPLKRRSVQPGYDTELCSVEYVEKINCAFANQIYAKMLVRKYGVNQCIDDSFNKYLIKKTILDFNLIYDPLACIPEPVVEACDPVVIVPPTPIPCQGIVDVSATISIPVVICTGVIEASAVINYQSGG